MARTRRKTGRTKKPSTQANKSTARRASPARGGGQAAAAKPVSAKGNESQFRSEVEALVDRLLKKGRTVSLRDARRTFERSYVEYIIRKLGGDRQEAADKLDIGFSTLKEKIRKSRS